MKIIVSHDVDHLFRDDHYKDFIYPKLWIRSTMEIIKGEYGFKEWLYRMCSPFKKNRHCINQLMYFDKGNGIPSTFFFGVEKGLGMSYGLDKAIDIIKCVDANGFDVGVHGIDYDDLERMKKEYDTFEKIIGRSDFGIRMHYVRFNQRTFNKMLQCGYLFDTTCFDKTSRDNCLKKPYLIGSMWEFPLNIMDGYLPKQIDEKKEETLRLIKIAEQNKLPYLTILFHDYQFCEGYRTEMEWYKWIVIYLKSNGYEFISYRDAIKELNGAVDEK